MPIEIFFDLLHSVLLQQRAAFYDIWTIVKSAIFWRMARSEKLSFEDKNYQKRLIFAQSILNSPIVESIQAKLTIQSDENLSSPNINTPSQNRRIKQLATFFASF